MKVVHPSTKRFLLQLNLSISQNWIKNAEDSLRFKYFIIDVGLWYLFSGIKQPKVLISTFLISLLTLGSISSLGFFVIFDTLSY